MFEAKARRSSNAIVRNDDDNLLFVLSDIDQDAALSSFRERILEAVGQKFVEDQPARGSHFRFDLDRIVSFVDPDA